MLGKIPLENYKELALRLRELEADYKDCARVADILREIDSDFDWTTFMIWCGWEP